jgi:DNA topoisomerase-2
VIIFQQHCFRKGFSSAKKASSSNSIDGLLKYERKSPLEHVLLRPGMYIGQTSLASIDTWVYNEARNVMEKKVLSYPPGLYKLFDEVLVNAADNAFRGDGTKPMKLIEVSVTSQVSKDKNYKLQISIKNDGHEIPTNIHPTENIHVKNHTLIN